MTKMWLKLLITAVLVFLNQTTCLVVWSAADDDTAKDEEWYTPVEQPADYLRSLPAEVIIEEMNTPQAITPTSEPIQAEPEEATEDWQSPSIQEENTQKQSGVDVDRLTKSNVLTINALGLVPSEPGVKYNFSLRLETAMADYLSLFITGTYKQMEVPSNFGGDYYKYGGGIGVGFYPFTKPSGNTGVWFGPLIRYEQGKINYSYQDFNMSYTDAQITYGGEIGYKWLVGEGGWLAISPYIGYYSSLTKYEAGLGVLDEHYTYYDLGLLLGIAF